MKLDSVYPSPGSGYSDQFLLSTRVTQTYLNPGMGYVPIQDLCIRYFRFVLEVKSKPAGEIAAEKP
jgi:hypothetical protein